MPFDHIRGQQTAIETLTRALESNLVHHAYRFEGAEGVGKELAAMAFAQALLCHEATRGCGRCDTCRRVVELNEGRPEVPKHPDVVLIGRGLYPPDLIGGKRENVEISVEQIRRLVLSRAAYAPHEGRAQVFIVRAADELSISAANALLKTLEEPRPHTHFVLLTSRPQKLLDTIRSRSLPVRFGPLPDDAIRAILASHDIQGPHVADAIEIAAGSAAVALASADPDASSGRTEFVSRVFAAVDAPDMNDAMQLAESLERDRSKLVDDLRALAAALARRVRDQVRLAGSWRHGGAALDARRYELVLDAIDNIERNGSSGLVVGGLIASLRHGWLMRPGEKPPIVIQRR